jgi:hypothetical protein
MADGSDTKGGWMRRLLGEPLFERLAAGLTGSELQSVLLEVLRLRARARTPSDVLAQYRRDTFVRPAAVDLRESVAIDACLFDAARDYETIELSPVAPLGVCSTVAVTDQNRVLSALRSTEVVSDPTNVLALECAERLRQGADTVRLATSQRVIRAQPVPKGSGFAQHFRIFVLATAGRERKDHAFTSEALAHHITSMLAALDLLEQHGYAFGARHVDVLARPARAAVADDVASRMTGIVRVDRKPLEHPYYTGGLRYMLWATTPEGDEMPFIDGGAFDWLARLTSDRRNVYVASGMGAQLVAIRFRRP